MRGSLSIESARSLRSRLLDGEALARLAVCGAVGVLAGLLAAHARLHVGLPGHRLLFWIIPVVAARLTFRSWAGATVGSLAAALVTMTGEVRVAAGLVQLPFVALAGIALDVAVRQAERRRLAARWSIPLVGLAGLGAGLVMCAERLAAPLLQVHGLLGLSVIPARLLSYGFFGLVSGLAGAALAHAISLCSGRSKSS